MTFLPEKTIALCRSEKYFRLINENPIIIENKINEIMYGGIMPLKTLISWLDEPTNNDPNAADETSVTFDAFRKTLSSDSRFLAETLYSSKAISRSSKW
ncbi:hypothetical protein MnBA_17330 [Marinobacterium sp. BA1]